MTSSFLKRKSRDFFRGKKAEVLVKQRNLGGDEINPGEIVTILQKTPGSDISLDIKSHRGITIYGVWCEQLELVKDAGN